MKGLKVIDIYKIDDLKTFVKENECKEMSEWIEPLFIEVYGWADRCDHKIVNIHFVPMGHMGTKVVVVYT